VEAVGAVARAYSTYATALHGLITLSRNDRLRPGHDTDRIDLLVAQFSGAGPGHLSERPSWLLVYYSVATCRGGAEVRHTNSTTYPRC